MIDGVLKVPGLRGLILETFGAGNAPGGDDGSLTAIIKAACARGIIIVLTPYLLPPPPLPRHPPLTTQVNVSQCQSGSVSPLYAPATILGNAGVVFGHDLTTEAALTKLSFLLALPGLSYEDIVSQMQYSIRGEITEMVTEQFKHPGSDMPTITVSSSASSSLAASARRPCATAH